MRICLREMRPIPLRMIDAKRQAGHILPTGLVKAGSCSAVSPPGRSSGFRCKRRGVQQTIYASLARASDWPKPIVVLEDVALQGFRQILSGEEVMCLQDVAGTGLD